MKIKKVLNNAYSAAKARKEILLGRLNPKFNDIKPSASELRIKQIERIFTCKCGRSIFDHPDMTIGNHYRSMPYHGALCPFLMIGERL